MPETTPDGDDPRPDEMFGLLYDELHGLARSWWRSQRPDQTLQPTALVHEAYLKLAQGGGCFESEDHFRAVAAKAMRQALIQQARARTRDKRGGPDKQRVTLSGIGTDAGLDSADILSLDDALTALEALNERHVRVVEMRFFAGMTEVEVGRVLGVSERTVRADWRLARAWLLRELKEHDVD